jgi:hypothetical protein
MTASDARSVRSTHWKLKLATSLPQRLFVILNSTLGLA